jgi:DNA-directed RNA polymerase subunit beta'
MPKKSFPELGGFVTSPKDMKQKSNTIYDSNGIYSEQIFGPVKDYCCQCGKLKIKASHNGQVCPVCGVLCASSNIRRTTFGKIEVPLYYIKPSKTPQLAKLLKGFDKNLLNLKKSQLFITDCKYLGISKNHSELKLFSKHIDPTDYNKYKILPFKITGLYTLKLALQFFDRLYNIYQIKELFDKEYITNILYVLPPGVRPHRVLIHSRKVQSSPVNSLYSNLLSRIIKIEQTISKENKLEDEEDQFNRVKDLIENGVITPDDSTSINLELDGYSISLQNYINSIYDFAIKQIQGKKGIIRNSILSRTIDFSARSVVRCDPSLPPWQIKVSKSILKKIWSDKFLYYLINVKNVPYPTAYKDYILNGDSEIYVKNEIFDEFLEWYYS